jgi:Ca2+-binding EF-hand superfamily protein
MNRLALGSLLLAACLASPTQAAPPRTGGQDFVVLGEARPVLVRAHAVVDGKAVTANWDQLLKDLFTYLDVNGDGVLSKAEALRAPSVEQLLVGGIDVGGGRRAGKKEEDKKLKDLDTDKDGKVSRAELAAYYRKNGLAPFQFQLTADEVDAVTMTFLNGPNPEPTLDEISKTTFTLLDTDGDGKLTRAELSAALDLLDRDDNDDEILTPRELVYSKGSTPSAPNPVMTALMKKGKAVLSSSGKVVVPFDASGTAPQDLVRLLQERYGSKKGPTKGSKLNRKDLGLDEAVFRQLDKSGDGVLDAAELAGFGKRAPDLEVVLRLGSSEGAAVEVVGPGARALGSRLRQTPESALLELGLTRVELRSSGEGYSNNALADIIEQQMVGQLDQADRDGNGILDEKEADKNPVYRSLFKSIDRDGDGKINKKDLLAYLKESRRLQARALAGCVALGLEDQSRGLFDLLDTNRDGKLSVRELRQAARLLESFDRDKKGYLTVADVPRSHQLKLRRGPAQLGGLRQLSLFERYYGGGGGNEEASSSRGPAWFRKMDRNRDGDVSRKEFLFGPEQFRRLDTDGDGLISLEEAEKAGAVPQPEKSTSRRTP